MSIGEPKTEAGVQNYVAQMYPKRYSGSGFVYHSRIVTDMMQGLQFREGRKAHKVLDVGCGTGFLSQLYPNFDILGVDTSLGMLERNPYNCQVAAAEKLPFADNTYDWVVSRSLLHHLEEPLTGLHEMHRVLKPGGTWVCWETNFSWLNNLVRKAARHTPRFSHWHKNFRSATLIQLVTLVGLRVNMVRYYGYVAYPVCGFPDILDFHVSGGVTRALMWVDEVIARTPLAPLGWAVMIRAHKPL